MMKPAYNDAFHAWEGDNKSLRFSEGLFVALSTYCGFALNSVE